MTRQPILSAAAWLLDGRVHAFVVRHFRRRIGHFQFGNGCIPGAVAKDEAPTRKPQSAVAVCQFKQKCTFMFQGPRIQTVLATQRP